MPEAHKKAVYTQSLIDNPKLSEDKVTGEFKGFPLEYRNGVIYLSKEYHHIHAIIEWWDEGTKDFIKRPVVFDSVKVTAEFRGKEFAHGFYGEDITIDCGYATAEFKLDGKKYKVDYGIFEGDNSSWYLNYYSDFDNDKKRLYFMRHFNSRVMDDFVPFRDHGLVDVLRFDKHVAPLFEIELETRKKKHELVEDLKLEAQQIGRQYDIERNPLPLQPIFKRAKEAGVVDKLIGGLRRWAMDRREHMSDWGEETRWVSIEEIASGRRRESFEDLARRTQAERLDKIADALQKFNQKPTKQQEKESAEWLAFDNALKKVDGMMAEEKDWSRDTGKFAARVIEEIKPICEPRKFAETLKRLMEFKKDDGVVEQLSALYSPMYFRNFIRMMGGDISNEELEELFGKGKERLGEYVRGVADETKGRELLLLSEEILKRC